MSKNTAFGGKISEQLTEKEIVARWEEILERVESGEIIVVERNGQPVVRLTRYASQNDQQESIMTP